MDQPLFLAAALAILGLTPLTNAEESTHEACAPEAPAPCYSAEECETSFLLGPENTAASPAVRPRTCGSVFITLSGFYWNCHQDGMEYALENLIAEPAPNSSLEILQELNNIWDAAYLTPNFKWNWGFKAGLGYASACDGWDIGALWTWYRGNANRHDETHYPTSRSLLALWSAFSPAQGAAVYATSIDAHWNLDLNIVDLELGREFWNSPHVSFRPHLGLRFASLNQKFKIEHKGGSWDEFFMQGEADQPAFTNEVHIKNDFKGVGIRAGLDSVWHLGCGFGLWGNFAGSLVYGRFTLHNKEENQEVLAPNAKTTVLDTEEEHFRASCPMLDLIIGVEWSSLFCQCNYGFTAMVGWENHLFFNQNQMTRVVRIGNNVQTSLPNNNGENVATSTRGDLDTQGWTLTLRFEF